jgi:hypothetical protein
MTLQQWLDQWKHKSQEVQDRVRVALDFMRKHYGTRDDKILSEMRCIDFSRPIELPALQRGTILVGSKDPRVSPYRAVYFTRSGHPMDRLGISTRGALRTDPRATEVDKTLYRYEVIARIPSGEALASTCAPAADTWSIPKTKWTPGKTVLAAGGGLQYLIPMMNQYLRFIP